MAGCHFSGFDERVLYDKIDYKSLARDLYDATAGMIGTDEKKVVDVFLSAIAEPVRRLLSKPVDSFVCTIASPNGKCSSGETKKGTYWQLKDTCAVKTVLEDGTYRSDADVSLVAQQKLGKALRNILTSSENDSDHEFAAKRDDDVELLRYALDEELAISGKEVADLMMLGCTTCKGQSDNEDFFKECQAWINPKTSHMTSEEQSYVNSLCLVFKQR